MFKTLIKNKKREASSLVFIIFFIVIFLALAAMAVDGTIILTNRVKLQTETEMAAMAAASEFNSSSSITAGQIKQVATETFNLLKKDGQTNAKIVSSSWDGVDTADSTTDDDVVVDMNAKKVTIYTSMISEPFFLSFLGVSGVKLQAKAGAISEALSVKANYAGVNWLTASAAYYSDILSKDTNMNDTAILQPLGALGKGSASYTKIGYANFGLLNSGTDNEPLSLGPGGFITIKLPAPIIDKPGYDLFIKEIGAIEGYMVFAGLDNDPQKPYVNASNVGAGISWKNITCSATPEDSTKPSTVYSANTDNLGYQDKFYGSAYFDLGNSCAGGLSMAKYIRIVDDNRENGFLQNNGNYYKALLYGEASTATSGADIDYITVLNHTRLIAVN